MSRAPKYKVCFVGETSTGKTSIVSKFMYDTFDASAQATIGIDFLSKTIHFDGVQVRLQLWDTAGQERFRSLVPGYIRDSSAIIVVYDVGSRKSFIAVEKWVTDVRDIQGSGVPITVVGNKTDLAELRAVPYEDGENLCARLGVSFIEVSAKAGFNIKAMFRRVAVKLLERDERLAPPEPDPTATPVVELARVTPLAQSGQSSKCRC